MPPSLVPPPRLEFHPVTLHFSQCLPGDDARGFVPSYHFRIVVSGAEVGHVNLRVGDTEHVLLAAGHVGFEVAEAHRGRRHALAACRALAPLARSIRDEHLLTCDPENLASRRTIELLGATFLDESVVPRGDPHYERGSKTKLRFRWRP